MKVRSGSVTLSIAPRTGTDVPVRLSPKQLMARMGWSLRTLRRRTPLIGHIKDGQNVIFPLECVEQYERERTVNPH